MAIPAAAQFAYTVTLRRGVDGVWRGRASPTDGPPHLVGNTPNVEIAGGILTLEKPTARRRWGFSQSVDNGPVPSKAVIAVGDALETVLHDEDVLRMHRGAMADVGLVLARGDFVLALGDVTSLLREFGITVEADPRADDVRFYYMRSLLDQPESQLVWLDPSSPEYESQLAELDRIPPHVTMVSIATRSDDRATSSAVNRRAVGTDGRRRSWGFNYERVDTRFQTREDFIAHLRALPQRRPNDFFLRFTVDGREHEVREGESVLREPWLFCVCEVASPDFAWSRSHIGVARAHPALTADGLRASVELILQKLIQIEPS